MKSIISNKKSNTMLIFIFIVLANILCSMYVNETIITLDFISNSYKEQLDINRIKELYTFREKFSWLGYALVGLMVLIRVLYTSVFLKIVFFFKNVKIPFKNIFRIALICDSVFLIQNIIKAFFLKTQHVSSFIEMSYFSPLSVLSFFKKDSVELYLVYPLQLLNLFEVIYVITLTIFFLSFFESNFKKSLNYNLLGYGMAFVFWFILALFINMAFTA